MTPKRHLRARQGADAVRKEPKGNLPLSPGLQYERRSKGKPDQTPEEIAAAWARIRARQRQRARRPPIAFSSMPDPKP
jgi:hypothetical protein